MHDGAARDAATMSETSEENKPNDAWATSLREVMRKVIVSLPDHATLGELVDAASRSPQMRPVLELFTVQELIDVAKTREKPARPTTPAVSEERAALDGGPAVIRRRADVAEGDLRILKALLVHGGLREQEIANTAGLTMEQLRLLLRPLKTKGFVHLEGSGLKRRYKITRHGSTYLRKSTTPDPRG